MSETLTKAAARNIFYGGTVFFFVIFIGLVVHSTIKAQKIAETNPITASVAAGKKVWEKHACVDCHTILGEGAYYAPELGNVWVRFGGREDASGAREALKAWFKGQPSGIAGRRQMPQFNMPDVDVENLIDFLKWTSEIDTQNWPPKVSG